MHRIIKNEIYIHRGVMLTRWNDETNKGIGTDIDLKLFKTFADARRYIDKHLDGTHDKEPIIIGEWKSK